MKKFELFAYGLLFALVVGFDRVTKYMVVNYLETEYHVSENLSFVFVLNRGISWGMLHSDNNALFVLLTLAIIGVLVFLVSYAYARWHDAALIVGETMVIAGAVSNIIDRVMYRGVVDFIVFSWRSFSWPAFNVADAAIVVGVFIMLISVYRERE